MTSATRSSRKPTVRAIAEHAGVSTATVDRVLNNRSSVRDITRQRVLQSRDAIALGESHVVRDSPWRILAILPRDAGPPTEMLALELDRIARQGYVTIDVEFINKLEPKLLVRKLRACSHRRLDGVVFQALDDPGVSSAVQELASLPMPCIGILSGFDSPGPSTYVGLNNRAAGRTAGYLMGRMARTPGSILIVTGSDLYRAHEDREMGFRGILRQDFRQAHILASLRSQDDRNKTEQVVREALSSHPDLIGIYNVGGGNRGIAKALKDASVADEITFIGHNLTSTTRELLLEGTMDAVMHVNLGNVARLAVTQLIAGLEGTAMQTQILPIEIITRENL